MNVPVAVEIAADAGRPVLCLPVLTPHAAARLGVDKTFVAVLALV